MNIENIQKILLECYSKDLCYPKIQNNYTENNKTFGMCAITSLVLNDYFGGEIGKIHVDRTSHYFNIIHNEIIDLTASQFDSFIEYKDCVIVKREDILTQNTKERYKELKNRVIIKLLKQIDNKIYKCYSCNSLVEKFPNNPTVFFRKRYRYCFNWRSAC